MMRTHLNLIHGIGDQVKTRLVRNAAMTARPKTKYVPACINPPMPPFVLDDPEALAEWRSFRTELDQLEASLQAEHPRYNWKQAMKPHKAEADRAIAALRRSGGR